MQMQQSKLSASQERATLKVLFLLAAMDGKITDEEKFVFRDSLIASDNFTMGSSSTNAFIEECVQEAEKLLLLREYYTDEEYVSAFLVKTQGACTELVFSPVAVRRAFASWVSLCLADGDYSDIERAAMKGLQKALSRMVESSTMSIADIIMNGHRPAVNSQFFNVTDEFVAEVERRCREIDALTLKLNKAKGQMQKDDLKSSLQYMVEAFEAYLNCVAD